MSKQDKREEEMSEPLLTSRATSHPGRWAQLWLGVVCMALIANLQYAWTLFVHPMAEANHWSVAAIQVAFSIFIALETWLTPVEGWIADHLGPQRGPKLVIAAGAVCV